MSANKKASARRLLRVFLNHCSEDKPVIQELYEFLTDVWVDPWLDKRNLIAGQKWQSQIEKQIRASDVLISCLSSTSVRKAGYGQRELRYALDVDTEKPDGTIFLMPVKLDECEIPDSLGHLHWLNYFQDEGHEQLLTSLQTRANELGCAPVAQSASRFNIEGTKQSYTHPQKLFGEGKFLYGFQLRVPHVGRRAVKIQLDIIRHSAFGPSETIEAIGDGLAVGQSTCVSKTPYELKLVDVRANIVTFCLIERARAT